MTIHVHQTILAPMSALFTSPYGSSEENLDAVVKAYEEILAPFSEPILRDAWRDVIANYTKSIWPPVGLIVKACQEQARKQAAATPQPQKLAPSQAVCFATPQGQYALREGHGHNFYVTCDQRGYVISQKATEVLISEMIAARTSAAEETDDRLKFRFDRIRQANAERESELVVTYLREG